MRNFLLLLSLMFASQVSASPCDFYGKFLDASAYTVGTVLECEQKETIKSDFRSWFHYDTVCAENFNSLCDVVVDAAVDVALGSVPERWECNPEAAKRVTKTALTMACRKYFPASE